MSWGCYCLMKCIKCGKEYQVEESTLVINQNDYDKCPICHSSGKIISQRSILDAMKEQDEKFKKRKKRII